MSDGKWFERNEHGRFEELRNGDEPSGEIVQLFTAEQAKEKVADALAEAFGFGGRQGERVLGKVDHPDVSVNVELEDAGRLIDGACGFGTDGKRFAHFLAAAFAPPEENP